MFCAYANGGSCTYNIDTLTEYAEKYSPFGAILTSWEKSDRFYMGGGAGAAATTGRVL